MKKYEVNEAFIKEVYQIACDSLKVKIKDEFPSVFKLYYNQWEKNDNYPHYLLFNEEHKRYGFDAYGNWFFDFYNPNIYNSNRVATEQEVSEALFTEIEKKYPIGSQIKCVTGRICEVKGRRMTYDFNKNIVTLNDRDYTLDIFNNGFWAEVILNQVELTLEQIADKFGVDVKQLKIKK